MTVRGTTTDMQPVGQFDLRRGRILILGQRIDFDEGSLQLVGNLDPQIHFVAETRSQDVTAIVTVSGRVSSPEITFSSEPPLPQDEVLAHVLFNRATADLSAFQLAQLASAAAELAGGGGGPGIISQIRGATGLDDLDIITTDEGATAVRAGMYLERERLSRRAVRHPGRDPGRAELRGEPQRHRPRRGGLGRQHHLRHLPGARLLRRGFSDDRGRAAILRGGAPEPTLISGEIRAVALRQFNRGYRPCPL